jgi:hypothetical protein
MPHHSNSVEIGVGGLPVSEVYRFTKNCTPSRVRDRRGKPAGGVRRGLAAEGPTRPQAGAPPKIFLNGGVNVRIGVGGLPVYSKQIEPAPCPTARRP